MTQIFGPVAGMYDDVRPGYPDVVRDAIVDYHGGTPESVAELGAGTGKGTELLTGLGAPVTCIEPDPLMADVLADKFPQVEVVRATFERWTPPPGGVSLIGCALAWHWLDPETRNRRAHDALTPGGTLAVFGHTYGYADPAESAAIERVIHGVDSTVTARAEHWILDDVRQSAVFADVREQVWHTYPVFSKRRYLRLMQTFSPFRRRPPEQQRAALDGLDQVVGDQITLDLVTTLVLARSSRVDGTPAPGTGAPGR
ncbi:class I SAM-dependent methyltransferase [Jidongwangia harbinensis]|uniref:class I SAM-dependent methyltransferase n=1 Tax=Jidongwangia harbinensis TaxID=2878561 RepID=UPI001CD94E7D|nr:class I SAM-dependent methyltransferase [Jidongwangia harbinensis]MCA2213324.1 class I SAM-dependent methyltransferase [Jidongwangia harbinensis]